MKTINEIKTEISALMSEGNSKETTEQRKKKIRKFLEFSRFAEKYLETNPSERSIRLQLNNKLAELDRING